MATDLEKLRIQRWVAATPDEVFCAWTDPEQLLKWWGPQDVDCIAAEVDLCIGGAYRIANRLPDKNIIWISGIYEVIERPSLLIYTWVVETSAPTAERVTVRFVAHNNGTNIELLHEMIASKEMRDLHQAGWVGCLVGLDDYFQS